MHSPGAAAHDARGLGGAAATGGVIGRAGAATLSIIVGLEREKARLKAVATRDTKTASDAEAEVAALSERVSAERARLGTLNALFARMPNAAERAPRQALGARDAVLSTKRILSRELERLGNERVVAESRLNRSREKNTGVRERVDALRLEAATCRGLHMKMAAELESRKAAIAAVGSAIDTEYSSRDRAHEEVRELLKQFEAERNERVENFRRISEEIDALSAAAAASAAAATSTATTASGGLVAIENGTAVAASLIGIGAATAAVHSGTGAASVPRAPAVAALTFASTKAGGALHRRAARAAQKLAEDEAAAAAAERKRLAFAGALSRIASATGYERTEDVVAIFGRYEEEKFAKAQHAERLVVEIEALEAVAADAHAESRARGAATAAQFAERAEATRSLLAAAVGAEAALAVTAAAVQSASAEVASLYPAVDFCFHALGVRSSIGAAAETFSVTEAITAAAPVPEANKSADEDFLARRRPSSSTSPSSHSLSMALPQRDSGCSDGSSVGGGGARSEGPSGQSPLRGCRGSFVMFSGDARIRHAAGTGVSAASLGTFMGAIEQTAADILHAYAAVMSTAALGGGGLAAAAFAARADALLVPSRNCVGGGDTDDEVAAGGDGEASAAAAAGALQARRAARNTSADEATAAFARQLAGGRPLLGPSAPPGRVLEAVTASALTAALAADSPRMAGELDGGPGTVGGFSAGAAVTLGSMVGTHAVSPPAASATAVAAERRSTEEDTTLRSLPELAAQAARRLATDRSIAALRDAAAAAAAVLAGGRMQAAPGAQKQLP